MFERERRNRRWADDWTAVTRDGTNRDEPRCALRTAERTVATGTETAGTAGTSR